jgi:hypothetical protein
MVTTLTYENVTDIILRLSGKPVFVPRKDEDLIDEIYGQSSFSYNGQKKQNIKAIATESDVVSDIKMIVASLECIMEKWSIVEHKLFQAKDYKDKKGKTDSFHSTTKKRKADAKLQQKLARLRRQGKDDEARHLEEINGISATAPITTTTTSTTATVATTAATPITTTAPITATTAPITATTAPITATTTTPIPALITPTPPIPPVPAIDLTQTREQFASFITSFLRQPRYVGLTPYGITPGGSYSAPATVGGPFGPMMPPRETRHDGFTITGVPQADEVSGQLKDLQIRQSQWTDIRDVD